ncbi:hypothetical protein HDU76_012805, partial [Blyttiomyces sp. JEL0837]
MTHKAAIAVYAVMVFMISSTSTASPINSCTRSLENITSSYEFAGSYTLSATDGLTCSQIPTVVVGTTKAIFAGVSGLDFSPVHIEGYNQYVVWDVAMRLDKSTLTFAGVPDLAPATPVKSISGSVSVSNEGEFMISVANWAPGCTLTFACSDGPCAASKWEISAASAQNLRHPRNFRFFNEYNGSKSASKTTKSEYKPTPGTKTGTKSIKTEKTEGPKNTNTKSNTVYKNGTNVKTEKTEGTKTGSKTMKTEKTDKTEKTQGTKTGGPKTIKTEKTDKTDKTEGTKAATPKTNSNKTTKTEKPQGYTSKTEKADGHTSKTVKTEKTESSKKSGTATLRTTKYKGQQGLNQSSRPPTGSGINTNYMGSPKPTGTGGINTNKPPTSTFPTVTGYNDMPVPTVTTKMPSLTVNTNYND